MNAAYPKESERGQSVDFSLNISNIFSYAGDIINAMLPVVYVSAGLALGFVVVNKIIRAFR